MIGYSGRAVRLTDCTINRIAQGDQSVSARLAHCPGLNSGVASDIGCGAGYDTFALGRRFNRVWAIDSSGAAIREARRAARLRKVPNIEFRRADAERVRPPEAVDLAWCNLMSHNVTSRRRLALQLASAMAPGGWLMYAEISEGYAVREIAQAIHDKRRIALIARVRQVIDGILGLPRFRFFMAGTVGAELAALGLDVQAEENGQWHGLTEVNRVYARRLNSQLAPVPPSQDPDYVKVPSALSWLRGQARLWLADGAPGFTEADMAELRNVVQGSGQPAAVLLLVLPMAAELGLSVPESRSRLRDYGTRAAARVRLGEPDWPRLAHLNDHLLSLLK
jgi:SAM-dependent methyltransferase